MTDKMDTYTVTVTRPLWDRFGVLALAYLVSKGLTLSGAPVVGGVTVTCRVLAPKGFQIPAFAGITIKKA
jgi:hypothetical protein